MSMSKSEHNCSSSLTVDLITPFLVLGTTIPRKEGLRVAESVITRVPTSHPNRFKLTDCLLLIQQMDAWPAMMSASTPPLPHIGCHNYDHSDLLGHLDSVTAES